jgi:hemerythrin
VEAEHRIQLKLLKVLLDALGRAAEDPARCGVLIRQLLDYSEAHFLSEQVLMREKAYPGYEQHAREHDGLLSELRRLAASWDMGEAGAAADVARRVEGWLLVHMRTTDHSLTLYLAELAAGR